jgi:hypothetical protein
VHGSTQQEQVLKQLTRWYLAAVAIHPAHAVLVKVVRMEPKQIVLQSVVHTKAITFHVQAILVVVLLKVHAAKANSVQS